VTFRVSNLDARLEIPDLLAHIGPLIPLQGYMNVDMKNVAMEFSIQMTDQQLANGRKIPAIQIAEANFNIDGNQMTFQMGGNPMF
jgi:hypothetical protein